MKNFKMLSAVLEADAEIINPNGETFVDLMVKPGLPMNPAEGAPPFGGTPTLGRNVFGLIAPGERPGDELVIRLLPHRKAKHTITPSVEISNRDSLYLYCIPADSAADYDSIDGINIFPGMVGPQGGIYFPSFFTSTSHPDTPLPGPAMVILRWVGNRWLFVAGTKGITDAYDMLNPLPPVDEAPEAST